MAIVGVYFAVKNVSHASLILSINTYLSLLSGTDNISVLKGKLQVDGQTVAFLILEINKCKLFFSHCVIAFELQGDIFQNQDA